MAKSLVTILYEVLRGEIGRNLPKDVGLTSFGIKERKVELVHPPTLDFLRKAKIIQKRYNFITFQQTL